MPRRSASSRCWRRRRAVSEPMSRRPVPRGAGSAQRRLPPAGLTAACALAAAVGLGGCAIAELRSDVAAGQSRVDAKADTLARERQVQAGLAAQRDQLLADLGRRELTLAQLGDRLERMRRLNDTAAVATPVERERRDERARRLDDMSRRTRALEADAALPAPEKARRAEALKEQTRKALEVLLVG